MPKQATSARTKTIKVKGGRRKLNRAIRRHEHRGWEVVSVSSRTKKWSWLAGIFTRKQIHTVTLRQVAEQRSNEL